MFGRQPFSTAPFCYLREQEPVTLSQRLQAFDHSGPFIFVRDASGPFIAAYDHSRPGIGLRDSSEGTP